MLHDTYKIFNKDNYSNPEIVSIVFMAIKRIGEIYEVASIKEGVSRRIKIKDAFECLEITETHVVLMYFTQEEVIQRLGEEKTDIIAVNLVQQLLKIVTKDQAVKMIQHRG